MVIGPSSVEVAHGIVEVFGKSVRENESIVVKKYRAIPVEALSGQAIVNVTVGRGGGVERRERIGCEMWRGLADKIKDEGGGYIILGKVDSGKSSLTVFLVNRCLEAGVKVGIMDVDVGQGDLGEPCLIGAAVPEDPIISLEDVGEVRKRFIGKTSPHGVEVELEGAIQDLYEWLRKEGCGVILVNFHGWVTGLGAHRHITEVIEKTGIEKLVFIQEGEELVDLVQHLLEYEGLKDRVIWKAFLEAPDTYKRSAESRREIRERKIRNYFSRNNFSTVTFNHGEVPIQGTGIFKWRRIDEGDPELRRIVDAVEERGRYIVYGERDGQTYRVLALGRGRMPLAYDQTKTDGFTVDIYASGRQMGLVAGFGDEEGNWEMGKLVSIKPFRRQWVFLRPDRITRPTKIILGRMILDEDNVERGTLPKAFFT